MNANRPFSQAVWDQTPAAVQDDLEVLEARVAALEGTVQRLEATLQHLTEQVQQNSRTSSRPPSSDPPHAPGKPSRREPSGRRPGGQPGHEGHTRGVVPVEEVDVVIPVKPERCRRCQQPLQGEEAQPQRHQVTEIPPVNPVVTASQLHQLVCPACGEVTRAEVPPGGPTGGFGPRVQVITARCTGADHLSKRTTQSVLEDLFGVSLGLGTIANLEQATAQAVAEPVAEARAYVQTQPAAYADETGWREGRQRAWLWTVVTAGVTIVAIRLSRRGKVAQELLGEHFWGWWATDRWSADSGSPTWRRPVGGGASAARQRGDDRTRGGLAGDRGGVASADPPDVPRVAPGPRWHAGTGQLGQRYAARPSGSGTTARSRANRWGAQDRGHVPGHPPAAPGTVDVRTSP